MKRHTLIFLIALLVFVSYAIIATYHRSFVKKDFILITEEDEEVLDAKTLSPIEDN